MKFVAVITLMIVLMFAATFKITADNSKAYARHFEQVVCRTRTNQIIKSEPHHRWRLSINENRYWAVDNNSSSVVELVPGDVCEIVTTRN